MNKKFIQELREAFRQRLLRKTGWGRIEIAEEFELAVNDVLSAMLDQIEESNRSK